MPDRLLRTLEKRSRNTKPKVLLVTPEITALPEGLGNLANYAAVKGGGLADISAGLVAALTRNQGLEFHVAMPYYKWHVDRKIPMGEAQHAAYRNLLGEAGLHTIEHALFNNPELYPSGEKLQVRRALAFQHGVGNLLDALQPDVVHCNDWMTGLVPAMTRARGIPALFTLHNIFTHYETAENVMRDGIDASVIKEHLYCRELPDWQAKRWNYIMIDPTATGIYAASWFNTVSPTFLQELINGDHEEITPSGVLEALRRKAGEGKVSGILNAPIDEHDPTQLNGHSYDTRDMAEGKALAKRDFQKEMGLEQYPDAPLLYWPHRLFGDQKGYDLFAGAIDWCLAQGAQIAIVADGDGEREERLGGWSVSTRGRMAYQHFEPMRSLLGMAAADFVLMPSRYEPCGLPQMEGMRYGALPVVRATGGLADSVEELDLARGTGNGFRFVEPTADAFIGAIGRALDFYRGQADERHAQLRRVREEAKRRFSFERVAEEYLAIYERLLDEGS